MNYEQAKELLEEKGQIQLFRFYGELNGEERAELLRQIERIDWNALSPSSHAQEGEISPASGLTLDKIAARREEFFAAGKDAVKCGKVAAVLLAGGQGTRLGCDAPKGTFDIGTTRPLYIFELLIGNLRAVLKECGGSVPLLVMTSEKNDAETRAFLKEHAYFGYPEEDVFFFVQDMAPATDFKGKILLEGKGRIALSPNGNGGWYSSLCRSGLLSVLEKRGIEWLNVFSVDNVLQRIADPVFVGATVLSGLPCGAKVVRKSCPQERVGVLCLKGGLPHVVEYYELSEDMANARDEKGDLLYSFGVTLNYLFRLTRLEEIAAREIPVHVVKKKIPCIDEAGNSVFPETENGYKYETLILDMVRLTGSCLPFEVEREKEFAPVKNRTGTDSVESARILLQKNGVKL